MNTVNNGKAWNTTKPSLELVRPTYGFVNTGDIVERFERQGWHLYDAKQARVRTLERQGYQKHLMRFRNEAFKRIDGLSNGNESIPELIVENSHDGTSALRMFFGVFRIACLNGIIAGSSLTSHRVIHSAKSITHIDEAIDNMTFNVPDLISKVERLNQVELTHEQAVSMAMHAANLRLAHTKNTKSIEFEAMLRPKRFQDAAKDAYSVFNVIQEKVIRGGIRYQQVNPLTGYTDYKTTRAISSVTQSVKLNRELWNIAESVAV